MSAIEQAIIELVVQGAGAFEQTNDRVQVDLTSTERAGRSAEGAARSAEQASRDAEKAAAKLKAEIGHTIHQLSAAVSVAKRLATIAGVEQGSGVDEALDAAGAGLHGALQGARLGSILGPEGTAIGAALGGLIGVSEVLVESARRVEKASEKIDRDTPDETTNAFLREAGLSRLDQLNGGRRQVQ